MTFEEVQRTMEFMLQHGARLDARLEKLAESVQGLRESQGQLRESQAQLRESQAQLRESQATLTAALLRLAELVEDLTEAQKRTDDQLRGTDERLNALINMVEKHITGPNHGRHPTRQLPIICAVAFSPLSARPEFRPVPKVHVANKF